MKVMNTAGLTTSLSICFVNIYSVVYIIRHLYRDKLRLLCACSKFCVKLQCCIKARLNDACSDLPQPLASKHTAGIPV